MSDLPESWEARSLGSLTELTRPICYGVLKPGAYDPYGIPLLRIQDLEGNRIRLDGVHRISGELDEEFHRSRLRGGEVLLSIQGTIGRTAVVPATLAGANISRTLAVIDPPSGLLSKFLCFYFQYLASLNAYATGGTTRASLNIGTIRKMAVPVPPIAEQDRIVAAIEEQFSRLNAGVAALKLAIAKLNLLRDAVLQAAVTGCLVPHSGVNASNDLDQILTDRKEAWCANSDKPYREPAKPASFDIPIPQHWQVASLEAITDPIRVICYGILMPKEHVDNGIPYVRVKDMRAWSIDLAGLKRTSPAIAGKYARASLKAEDLLLSIRGSYGRVAIVPEELEGGNITQDSARIASHPNVDHRYLLYFLGGSVANRYYSQVARGVAVKGVNIGDLRTMPIPIPPQQEQRAIVDEVERQLTLLDAAGMAVELGIRSSSSLRTSILAAAFSGQLVAQDPNEEPASVLLKRITSERVTSNGGKSTKARKHQVPRRKSAR